jgi:hypothetical protein
MEGIEKPHMVKYKAITNDWNNDDSCMLTSLPVWDLENFKRLVFVVQSVQYPGPNCALCLCHELVGRRKTKTHTVKPQFSVPAFSEFP